MLCAVAVVQGFKQQITNKIAGFNAHLQIYRLVEDNSDPEADNLLTLTPTLRSILDSEPYVAGYEMELNMPVILKTPQDFKGIYIKGTDGSDIRSFLGSQLTAGKMPDFSLPSTAYDLALSQKMADDLGLKVGDSIPAFFMNDELRAQKYRVAATYSTHFEQFDDLIALGNIAPLREMANIGQGQGVNIRVVTTDFDLADGYADRLRKRLNSAYTSGEVAIPYRVESVTDRSAAYFSWLSLLDTNVTVILTLMTIVACITLIAAMLIQILDKVRLIGILRALGATRRKVCNVFVFMALRIALLGIIIGNGIGLLILFLQQKYHFLPLDADSYYIDYVPVQMNVESIIILNVAVTAVVFLALLLPATVAGRISPAESMRYQD